MNSLIYSFNKSTEQQIKDHFWRVNADFSPPLHSYVDIAQYAQKLAANSVRLEVFIGVNLIGLIAGYYNPDKQFIFGSNFSIEKEYRGKGMELFNVLLCFMGNNQNQVTLSPEMKEIGNQFIEALTEDAKPSKLVMKSIHTEVNQTNHKLILYYRKLGFRSVRMNNESIYLIKDL